MMKKHLSSVPRAMVIHSPHAGRSASLSHTLTALERAGVEMVEVLPIAVIADTPVLGQQWKASGIDLVVADARNNLGHNMRANITAITAY